MTGLTEGLFGVPFPGNINEPCVMIGSNRVSGSMMHCSILSDHIFDFLPP
jgi:hypothetical protein